MTPGLESGKPARLKGAEECRGHDHDQCSVVTTNETDLPTARSKPSIKVIRLPAWRVRAAIAARQEEDDGGLQAKAPSWATSLVMGALGLGAGTRVPGHSGARLLMSLHPFEAG